MRDALVWSLFFATTIWGHVAMKVAVDRNASLLGAATSAWGITAVLAWGASSVLWMLVLAKQSLFRASTVSSLRYVLVVAAAVIMTRRAPSVQSVIGAVLVAIGVSLARE
jgi:drug/metabolite transporter (DMT)-like permease